MLTEHNSIAVLYAFN